MSLLRYLGISGDGSSSGRSKGDGDTATVRRIAAQLDRLEPDVAKYLAGFAYVLARVANADLSIDDDETAEMERIAIGIASLSPGEAALVVQIAKSQARLLGGTENYVVTREFRSVSTRLQRGELLECLYAVAATSCRHRFLKPLGCLPDLVPAQLAVYVLPDDVRCAPLESRLGVSLGPADGLALCDRMDSGRGRRSAGDPPPACPDTHHGKVIAGVLAIVNSLARGRLDLTIFHANAGGCPGW